MNPTAGATTAPGKLKVASVEFEAAQIDAIAASVSVLVVCGTYKQL